MLDTPPPVAEPRSDLGIGAPADADRDGSSAAASTAPRRDHADGRRLRRRLRLPLAVSVVVQAILVAGDRMPSVDAMSYFATGRNVLAGNGYTRSGGPELHFPPVAPVTLAVLERLTGSEMAALRLWNLGWGVAAVLLLTTVAWYLSRDDTVAVATAWFATFVPGVVTLATKGGSGSELATACFVIGAALVTLHALDPGVDLTRRRRTLELAGAGLLVGTAYLTRPESLMPGLIIGACAVLVALRDRRRSWPGRLSDAARSGAAFGVAALLLIAPYVTYTHHHTGSWSLTSKTQDASIDAWRAVAQNDRLERDQILYAIQPDGVSLGPETRSLLSIAAEHPRNWMTIGWINATTIFDAYVGVEVGWGVGWELLPLFLLLPALWQVWRTRRRRSTLLLAAVGAFPLLTCFLFFSLPRYLILTTAVLIPFGSWGLVELLRRLAPPPRRVAWGIVGVLTATSFLMAAWMLLPGSSTAERTEQRTAGRWIAANTPADARIMTRSFHVQGYSERDVVAFPSAQYPEVLAFAQRMGVDYVVADESTMRRRRPEVYDLLMLQDQAPPGLALLHEFTEDGQTVRIFALDPPAPPTDQPPLPLGYVSD